MNYEFKVGDIVQIKEWNEMVQKFGLDENGDIECICPFKDCMKHLCGQTATIYNIGLYTVGLKNWTDGTITYTYKISVDMIKPVINGRYIATSNFEPCLMCALTHYGVLGTQTKIKDAHGVPLKIGDTVLVYNENKCHGESIVAYYYMRAISFVSNILGSCNKDGTIKDGWTIIKNRSYEDIKHGETIGAITVLGKNK